MPQNKSNIFTLTLINISKRIFSTAVIPAISLSISAHTQAQENTEELILLNNIYSAISLDNTNNALFLHRLPNDFFYQLSQNMGMNNVVIDYFGDIEEIHNIDDMDTFYAAHIRDETGASLRIAFNSHTQAVDINFGDTVIQIEPNSAYVALRNFNTLFSIYDFGGEIRLDGDTFDIYFPYSIFSLPVTSYGLDYVITGETLSIENLGVDIKGWNYIIGTLGDDIFTFQEMPTTDTFIIDGGGGEDIISFVAIDDIDNEEPTDNNDNNNTITIDTPLSNTIISNGETTLDTGVINLDDWIVTVIGDITLVEDNELSNEDSSDHTTGVVVGITPENDNIVVDDDTTIPGDFTINDPTIGDDLVIIDTETTNDILPIDTESEFTIDVPESDSFEEDKSAGGGSFSYLTLFYLAFFSFLQRQRNNKIKI